MIDVLTNEEKIGFALRQLYSQKGYRHYSMSKFEEYDFYARNKSFLVSDAVITFTDTNGKLMALKPDVTLSIVKGSRLSDEPLYKVYYNENVYRVSSLSHRFSEITQTGLECIGQVDDECRAEVLSLAAASLRYISPESILSISHLDILSGFVKAMGLEDDEERAVLKCIADKNLSGISEISDNENADRLKELISTSGKPSEVFPKLRQLGCSDEYFRQLEKLIGDLEKNGYGDMVNIDFSIVNDQTYYNGIVFRGFVSGIPFRVLAGGQYDGLLKKMGRDDSAIGFAVYLDMLDYLPKEKIGLNIETGEETV
ncbi:MAG: ATP phosphoribosyltransferase regulatory subunit [Lachnospiraceae bacterium]|nr:ATP phosphoribosyltransferase regulatory subunit [Lachnospiraceae bacterium]